MIPVLVLTVEAGRFQVPWAIHSRCALLHCGSSAQQGSPRHGETNQAPRYLPSEATTPGPKG
eukprot:2712543-Lingulodinium_polyedra.AAC.1